MTALFITCGSGLEPFLVQELQELGYSNFKEGYRGVHIEVEQLSDIYRLNYCLRVASRVLMPLNYFSCYDEKSIYQASKKIDWLKWIPRGKTFAIDATVSHPRINHSLYAAQVVKDAICDQHRDATGFRPSVNIQEPDIQLNLFIHEKTGILSFDTSGLPLYKRGYRQEGSIAPLQETLAAAILRIAGYKKGVIFADPCCGSGTFLVEAALMATNTAPGYLRKRFGFMNMPDFDHQKWLEMKAIEDEKREPLEPDTIMGNDIERDSIYASRANLKAAGFLDKISLTRGDLRDYNPTPLPNFIIANPPYGKRLEEEVDLKPLYRAVGDFLKVKSAKPAKGFVLTGNLELTKEVGLSAKRRHVLENGGIPSRLLEFDLY